MENYERSENIYQIITIESCNKVELKVVKLLIKLNKNIFNTARVQRNCNPAGDLLKLHLRPHVTKNFVCNTGILMLNTCAKKIIHINKFLMLVSGLPKRIR